MYFVILALIPLGVATWVLNRSTERSERDKVDTRLEGAGRAGASAFSAVVAEASQRAQTFASSKRLQLALKAKDRTELAALVRTQPNTAVLIGGKLVAGSLPRPAAVRFFDVPLLGRVVVSIPFDNGLVRRLAAGAPLAQKDRLTIVRDSRVIAGPASLVGQPIALEGRETTVAGKKFRAYSARLVAGPQGARLVALSPRSQIDRAVTRFRRYLILAVAASLLTVALLAYTLGQPILRSLGELTRVARLADRDELTDLANRRGFRDALTRELRRADRFGKPVALILTDLDDFKQVNDRYGHQVGDDVLLLFAEVLRAGAREVDLPARIGGEEFALLLPETDLAGGEQLAERLRRSLADRSVRLHDGRDLTVTASFGVSSYPEIASEAELQSAADAALYRAKAAGKNAVATSGRAQV